MLPFIYTALFQGFKLSVLLLVNIMPVRRYFHLAGRLNLCVSF